MCIVRALMMSTNIAPARRCGIQYEPDHRTDFTRVIHRVRVYRPRQEVLFGVLGDTLDGGDKTCKGLLPRTPLHARPWTKMAREAITRRRWAVTDAIPRHAVTARHLFAPRTGARRANASDMPNRAAGQNNLKGAWARFLADLIQLCLAMAALIAALVFFLIF